MKLYGAIGSAYTARVILTARCKGIELPVEFPPGEGLAALKTPEYLQLNPLGKIPALGTEHGCLVESAVICEYLDEIGGGVRLMPADAFERARARMLIQVTDQYVMTNWSGLSRNINPATRDAAATAAALASLRGALAQLEKLMGAGPFALGAGLTLADTVLYPGFVHLVAVLREFFGVSDLLRDTPKIARWFEHLGTHTVAGPTGREQFESFLAAARRLFFR